MLIFFAVLFFFFFPSSSFSLAHTRPSFKLTLTYKHLLLPPPSRFSFFLLLTLLVLFSGLARTLGRAAFARPATPVARRAFQPRTAGLPSLARFASSEANVSAGKIHQVIGAVVDGMLLSLFPVSLIPSPSLPCCVLPLFIASLFPPAPAPAAPF